MVRLTIRSHFDTDSSLQVAVHRTDFVVDNCVNRRNDLVYSIKYPSTYHCSLGDDHPLYYFWLKNYFVFTISVLYKYLLLRNCLWVSAEICFVANRMENFRKMTSETVFVRNFARNGDSTMKDEFKTRQAEELN